MPRSNQPQQIPELIEQLQELVAEMVDLEAASLCGNLMLPEHQHGARNLLHYVALRRHDVRNLQRELSSLGLSSLGRTESHVLGAVRTVLNVLRQLDPTRLGEFADEHALTQVEGRRLLDANSEALLGPAPENRKARIMVTMPSEAATDYGLVRKLLAGGMNCMRINCAHDGPDAWAQMVENLRRASAELNKTCTIEMDMAGPKLRTGPIQAGPAVLKYRPRRDAWGHVKVPARIWLTPGARPEVPPAPADASLPVPNAWLTSLEAGDRVDFVDARGARRSMEICEPVGASRWAQSWQTAYLEEGLILTAKRSPGHPKPRRGQVGEVPAKPQSLLLKPGDPLVLTRALDPGHPAVYNDDETLSSPARIGVTLPEFFDCVRPNEPIWFDDGNIGGIVTAVSPEEVHVRIVHARPEGEKLGAEKGINVPGTDLRVSPLTAEDLEALEFIVKHADIVGFSFVRTNEDVRDLLRHLASGDTQNRPMRDG